MFTLLEFGFYIFVLTFFPCVCIENEVMVPYIVSQETALGICEVHQVVIIQANIKLEGKHQAFTVYN